MSVESDLSVQPLAVAGQKRKSPVFQHFGCLKRSDTIVDHTYYYCQPCFIKLRKTLDSKITTSRSLIRPGDIHRYKRTVSTHALHLHLRAVHNIDTCENAVDKDLPTIKNFFKAGPKPTDSLTKKKRMNLNTDMFYWFTGSLISYNVLETDATQIFLSKHLNLKKEEIPSRNSVMNAGTKCYREMKKFVYDQISNDNHISGATSMDIWTCSHSKRSFIGLSYHYIDSSWTLRAPLYDAEYFWPPHTGERIDEYVKGLFDGSGLGRTAVHVTDQASNNVNFGSKQDNTRISCDSHGLHHLVIDDGVKAIERSLKVVKKAKAIVRHVIWRGSKIADKKILEEFEERNQELCLDEQYPLSPDLEASDQSASKNKPAKKSSVTSQRTVSLKQEVPTR